MHVILTDGEDINHNLQILCSCTTLQQYNPQKKHILSSVPSTYTVNNAEMGQGKWDGISRVCAKKWSNH